MNFYKIVIAFCLAIFLKACVSTKNKNYSFNQKYSQIQAKEDISTLKSIYEFNHPSLYWYTTKDTIDKYFYEAINSIKDSITEIELKNKIAKVLAQIKCGHTSIRFSKQFTSNAPKFMYPQFPLSLKTWDDSLVVLGYYNKEDSALKPGTIITSINNRKTKQLLDTFFMYLPTDGEAINFKSQVLSNNFPAWYKNIFGLDSTFKIGYLDSNKVEKNIIIKWHKPIYSKVDTSKKILDSLKKVSEIIKKNLPTKKEQKALAKLKVRNITFDTTLNTAFIRLTTFTYKGLKGFIKDCFKEIETKKIENVVFDIRENGGGRVNNAIYLLQYLKDTSFKISDSTYTTTRKIYGKKYIKHWFSYWAMINLFTKQEDDDFYHFKHYETKYFKPFSKNHFNGNIYIVQGGYSFSAATIFSSFLKGQKNVTIVGEESGGGFYGNSAMNIPDIYLPNSKLIARLPLYRYVMNKNRPKGKGVLPDVEAKPVSTAYAKNLDLKIEKVKELIRNNKKE